MVINADTKIAAILKHHDDALETIISISPAFQKLRNPLLRKLMAGRTSISMACKLGGCTVERFLEKLKPLGFEVGELSSKPQKELSMKDNNESREYLKSLGEERVVRLDVRAMLAGGTDPLEKIIATIGALKRDQVLLIINSFEPTPLINLLNKKGFSSYVETVNESEIHTWFINQKLINQNPEPIKTEDSGWDELVSLFEGRMRYVDVRQLEMPQPMHSILEALESLPPGDALYVYHKRIPVFLLPELSERGFDYRTKTLNQQEVHLLIFRETL